MKINFIKLLYEEENDMKKNKGITLVALVVTIVVLLILAGVSINLVLGNNGIIAKAKDAETKSAEASQNDLKGMNALTEEMNNALGEKPKVDLTKYKIGDFVIRVFVVFFHSLNSLMDEFFIIRFLPDIQFFHIHIQAEFSLVVSACFEHIAYAGQQQFRIKRFCQKIVHPQFVAIYLSFYI